MTASPAATLDPSLVTQTAPPGSMRFYALLFAPPDRRIVLTALYLLEDELNATARGTHHDVAHTRLKWWSEEMDRLARGQPAHPATRALQAGHEAFGPHLQALRGLVESAAMDLALVTYADDAELAVYFDRSGGVLAEFAARWLLEPNAPSDAAMVAVRSMGALIRRVETLRDLRLHITAGRVYVPLSNLDRAGIDLPGLRSLQWAPRVLAFAGELRNELATALADAMASVPRGERAALRPLLVQAALHVRLLHRLDRDLPQASQARIELGPFEKLWCSWRAARRAR